MEELILEWEGVFGVIKIIILLSLIFLYVFSLG